MKLCLIWKALSFQMTRTFLIIILFLIIIQQFFTWRFLFQSLFAVCNVLLYWRDITLCPLSPARTGQLNLYIKNCIFSLNKSAGSCQGQKVFFYLRHYSLILCVLSCDFQWWRWLDRSSWLFPSIRVRMWFDQQPRTHWQVGTRLLSLQALYNISMIL